MLVTADRSSERLQDLMRGQNKHHPLLQHTAGLLPCWAWGHWGEFGEPRDGGTFQFLPGTRSDGAELREPRPRAEQTGCRALCKDSALSSISAGRELPKMHTPHPGSGTVTTWHPVTGVTPAGTGPGQQRMQSVPNSAQSRNSIHCEHILLQRKNPATNQGKNEQKSI